MAGLASPGRQSSLTFQKSGTHIILTWDSGQLQSATSVTGPWTAVPGYSPLTVTPGDNRRQVLSRQAVRLTRDKEV